MSFCQKCGSQMNDAERICQRCGFDNFNPNMNVSTGRVGSSEEVLNLTGQTDTSLPQQGKYKPLLWAGLIMIPVLIVYALAGRLFFNLVMERSRDILIMGLLIVSIPFVLGSIPFVIGAKKKAVGTTRKLGKGHAALLYVMVWLTIAAALVAGFADAFSTYGMLPTFSIILFAIMALLLVLVCNMYAHQNGVEAYYSLTKAIFTGFALSSPIGYGLGWIMQAMEKGIVIFLVLLVVFFLFGGRIIFVRQD